MPEAVQLVLAALLAFAGAVLLTPVAIRVAVSTGFLDKPADYKGHAKATPYLGGAAVMAAFVPVALVLGGTGSAVAWILGGTLVMALVGTVDDRHMLGPLARVAVEAAAATMLWAAGFGWSAFSSDVLSLAVTIVWVVGLVNAFNLMDNLDGATGTVGAVCAAGIGVVALVDGATALAAVAFALSGACAGFLVHNLRRPARIFLGDGGSMAIGFLLAAILMAVSRDANGLGAAAVVAAAPLVGLPVLDTTLVMISRSRRGMPLFTGGRDHLTHRLLRVADTPQRVAMMLAAGQAALCGLGVGLLHLGGAAVAGAGLAYVVLGTLVIVALERSASLRPAWFPRADAPALTRAPEPAHSEAAG